MPRHRPAGGVVDSRLRRERTAVEAFERYRCDRHPLPRLVRPSVRSSHRNRPPPDEEHPDEHRPHRPRRRPSCVSGSPPSSTRSPSTSGTERAFTGEYWDCHDDGPTAASCATRPLFVADTKFESGTRLAELLRPARRRPGRPPSPTSATAWSAPRRSAPTAAPTSATSSPTGPRPTGHRYCMNSASLRLDRDADRRPIADEATERRDATRRGRAIHSTSERPA